MKKSIIFTIIMFVAYSQSVFAQQYITGGDEINISEAP
jgi:hypothetical protein